MIYFISRNVSMAGLKTAYYEIILYIMHIRNMHVHNLYLKPKMMNGKSLLKTCFAEEGHFCFVFS